MSFLMFSQDKNNCPSNVSKFSLCYSKFFGKVESACHMFIFFSKKSFLFVFGRLNGILHALSYAPGILNYLSPQVYYWFRPRVGKYMNFDKQIAIIFFVTQWRKICHHYFPLFYYYFIIIFHSFHHSTQSKELHINKRIN